MRAQAEMPNARRSDTPTQVRVMVFDASDPSTEVFARACGAAMRAAFCRPVDGLVSPTIDSTAEARRGSSPGQCWSVEISC